MHKALEKMKNADKKRMLIAAIALVCAIVIIVAILLISKNNKPNDDVSSGSVSDVLGLEGLSPNVSDGENEKYVVASDTAYYTLGLVDPELKEDMITSVVNEMFYTKGGYLYLYITFGNGSDKAVELQSLDVKVENGFTDAVIAEFHTNDVTQSIAPQGIKIPAGGTTAYKLYIDPAQVKDAYDNFEAPVFSISASSRVVEE